MTILLIWFLVAFWFWRINKIFNIRNKAMDAIEEHNKSLHITDYNQQISYTRLFNPGPGEMLFMLTKWTFEDFYPDLVKWYK